MKTSKLNAFQTHQHLARASTEQKNLDASFSQKKNSVVLQLSKVNEDVMGNGYFHIVMANLMECEDLSQINRGAHVSVQF